MKREREIDSLAMANCLMLLSREGGQFEASYSKSSSHRVFECKTCNRQFPSFQALGGHRASHKKPRLMAGEGSQELEGHELGRHGLPVKPKTHECSICGLEFAIGQALGGHMRRHRAAALNENVNNSSASSITMSNSSGGSFDSSSPAKKKVNTKRVLFLDLNLTPLENDLQILRIGKATPLVDCFY
ncbi:hypothetical protein L6164_008881 [Bauhinia variegata]|uniref:Uncharacterized protein n=1 Tax=Bauhinia variegata TaxID=167791 RepID=A0ACB9PJ84_BAUVA|nr:hypothetical protein L6164_008881 [Bauhinia variegata]